MVPLQNECEFWDCLDKHFIQHRILMVCDFFYPNFGGVENHIYYLSLCLIERGHKVVVLTHSYGNRTGIRYMTNGLKVYYAPRLPFHLQTTFPTLWGTLPLLRTILVRERISIVHGHQSYSNLCHEAILHARTMNVDSVFTDHSLSGFADAESIHMNKLLTFTLSDIQHCICVSHTAKENTVLKASLSPYEVSVIPNAVDPKRFVPEPSQRDPNFITIVIISRLVYRKGIDLLVELIPKVCQMHPKVRFIIGGDGSMRGKIEEMRDRFYLHSKVQMLGRVSHSQVRNVLNKGHIFVNSSLTESFCIAILEACCCGLLSVSTRVGGVPEILPSDMLLLANPAPWDMMEAIGKAIEMLPRVNPWQFHERIKRMYSWRYVAERTEIVYDKVFHSSHFKIDKHEDDDNKDDDDEEEEDLNARYTYKNHDNMLKHFLKYYSRGFFSGKLFCFVLLINHIFLFLLNYFQNINDIDVSPDFPFEQYQMERRGKKRIGNEE